MKEAKNQNLWNFELLSQESMIVPLLIIVGFQQRDRQDSQNLKNNTFCRLPVTSAQCMIGNEFFPGSGILLKSGDDDYSQGYGQIKQAFRASSKDDIFQPCISGDNFRSSNVMADDVSYNLCVFDIQYH